MKPEKLYGTKPMSIAAEMKDAITLLAGPRGWHDNRKGWLNRAARAAGISSRQAYSLFYGEAKNPRAEIVERVREALRKRHGETLKEARNAYSELTQSIQRAESALRLSGENMGSVEVAALREVLGGDDRSMGGRVKLAEQSSSIHWSKFWSTRPASPGLYSVPIAFTGSAGLVSLYAPIP